MREYAWLGCRVITGILCATLSLQGVYEFWAVDLRADALLSVLYCALPASSLIIFLFARGKMTELCLQTMIALGYFMTFSMLNWRTCSELGYCGSVTKTIMDTAETRSSATAFAVVVFTLATVLIDRIQDESGIKKSH